MNLVETIRSRLERSAPFHDHVEQIVASEGGLTVRCDVQGAERLSCALRQIECVAETGAPLPPAELLSQVNAICGKVTYLLEPLAPIEVDPGHGKVLVRSKAPRQKEGKVSYYELLASGDRHLSLRRYAFDSVDKKRSLVEFYLTKDQLDLLLTDLIASAASTAH